MFVGETGGCRTAPGAASLVRLNALTRPRLVLELQHVFVTKSQIGVTATPSARPGAPHPATVDSLCDITETEAAV